MLLYLWMIIQIVCESLPISSSGHIQLQQKIMAQYQLYPYIHSDLFAFDYILQGLSSIIIFSYFFPYWWKLIVRKKIAFASLFQSDLWISKVPSIFLFGCIADGITFLFWRFPFFEKIIFYLFSHFDLAFGFMMTTVALWSLQFTLEKEDIDIWNWKNAFIVGVAQGIALLPGVSRFGLTIAALQWLGYQPRIAFCISFLLQFPLIIAGALRGFLILENQEVLQTMISWQFLLLFLFAALLSYKLLKFVGEIIDKNLLWKFSYYMIIPIFIALYF